MNHCRPKQLGLLPQKALIVEMHRAGGCRAAACHQQVRHIWMPPLHLCIFPSKPKYSYSDASSFRPYHAILVQGVVFVEARPGRLQFDGLGSRVHALGRKKSKPHGPRRPEPSLPGQARSRPSLTDPHIELLRRYIYIYGRTPIWGPLHFSLCHLTRL